MDTYFIKALILGVLVMLALYLSLSKTFDIDHFSTRRTLDLFSGGVGLLTTFSLIENPAVLNKYVNETVIGGLGVVLAIITLARKR
ncbi:MAG: hypothetical protein HOG55_17880 [Anaerolineae bacterium]|jgi:hypothetical protein|nr:hypothetical protein [Anaerolineae bacterium]MBT6322723.1 hypothetical protein [Anaerolineae bacterium]